MSGGDPVTPRNEATSHSRRIVNTTVDLRLYSLDVVQAAAYRFGDLGCALTGVDWESNAASISFLLKADMSDEELLTHFRQELTDQALRLRIRTETEHIRNVILAHAFADSALAKE